MSVHYIIDGYNIVNHRLFPRTHKKITDPRVALTQFVLTKRLTKSPKNDATIVFDGHPAVKATRDLATAVRVVYSGAQTADEKIIKMVEVSPDPKNILVVSDDNEIRFVVKALGARPVSVEEFILPESQRARASGAREKKQEKDPLKQELTYTQIHQINQELKKLWLSR